MTVQIGAKLDSGFDDPIGMLQDCHRRIERFLSILCGVAQCEQTGALNAEERSAVESALQYFRVGGQRHTRDEEDSLFPRLRAAAPPATLAAVGGLEHEHREANALHGEVERLFRQWLASGALDAEDGQALVSHTSRLRLLYAEHIDVEETVVFPQAAKVLDRDSIAAMGSEFRARRQ